MSKFTDKIEYLEARALLHGLARKDLDEAWRESFLSMEDIDNFRFTREGCQTTGNLLDSDLQFKALQRDISSSRPEDYILMLEDEFAEIYESILNHYLDFHPS